MVDGAVRITMPAPFNQASQVRELRGLTALSLTRVSVSFCVFGLSYAFTASEARICCAVSGKRSSGKLEKSTCLEI